MRAEKGKRVLLTFYMFEVKKNHHHHSFIHMFRLRPAPDVCMTVLKLLTAMVPPSTDSAGKIPTIST